MAAPAEAEESESGERRENESGERKRERRRERERGSQLHLSSRAVSVEIVTRMRPLRGEDDILSSGAPRPCYIYTVSSAARAARRPGILPDRAVPAVI
jgi:hypothetical protein